MPQIYVIRDRQYEVVEVGLELTIGRGYSNRLRLEGSDVSRAHAIVYRRGAEYILRDLDSKNGVRVNGKRVPKHVLQPGDQINICKYVMLFDPAEPVDLSAWLDEDQSAETHGAATDQMVQKRHHRCAPQVIEESFHASQTVEGLTIARAGSALRFAYQAISRLGGERDRGEVYQRALDWAVECFAAQRGFIAVREERGRMPRTVAMYDVRKRERIEIHHRIIEWLFEKGEAMISSETSEPDAGKEETDNAHRIGMPLLIDGRVHGFIYLENDPPIPPFSVDDLQRLYCIALVTSRRLKEMEFEAGALVIDKK